MSSSVAIGTYVVAGPDWTAQLRDDHYVLSVAPWSDVTAAIGALLPAESHREWLFETAEDDEAGWEVWILTRV